VLNDVISWLKVDVIHDIVITSMLWMFESEITKMNEDLEIYVITAVASILQPYFKTYFYNIL